MGKIESTTFFGDSEVCSFLNDAQSHGWNLNDFFIQITHYRGDMMKVFYDEDIMKRKTE